MPKREDEYWAGTKEPKGVGLCPFCGTSDISYNPRFRSWRCNKNEHIFSMPSYGPGRDFGKEARLRSPELANDRKVDPRFAGCKVNPRRKIRMGGRGSVFTGLSKGFTRFVLNLMTLGGLVWMGWYAKEVFTQSLDDPLKGSLILIGSFVGWILFIRLLLRRYRRTFPSFKLTVVAVLCVLVVFTFVGVQPMASYKDGLIEGWTTAQPETEFVPESPLIPIPEPTPVPIPKSPPTVILVPQPYAQLFNEFRIDNRLLPLRFDPSLNKLAKQRAVEISLPGNFSHEGIEGYGLGENIAMMAYSSDSNAYLLELWASSPGHRANMLGSQYTRTGFARVGRYAVQLFGW